MSDPEKLIADYLDDTLSDSDQSDLNLWLKADAVNMRRFAEAVMFEQQIQTAAKAEKLQQAASGFIEKADSSALHSRWSSWRPVTAAAAGIVFGILSASVVLGFVSQERQKIIPLFNESFEDVNAVLNRGFPSDADQWSGDVSAVVSNEGGVSPKAGRHMARLTPVSGRRFCAAACIVDLAKYPALKGNETRTLEVTASFHGMGTEWLDRNQIRLAAFSESPPDVKAIWNADKDLEQALQHTGRTVKLKPGDHGWQTLKVSMEIPVGSRSLVIHLGAGIADDAGPKTPHYVDGVLVHIISHEAP